MFWWKFIFGFHNPDWRVIEKHNHMNNQNAIIKSPVDDGILPLMLTVIMTVIASIGIGWVIEANLLVSLAIGLGIWMMIFFIWLSVFLKLAAQTAAKENNKIQYEIKVIILEERKTGYTERFPFVLNLKPLQLYNVINHLANGKGISHTSLSQIGLSRNQVTEIQEKFFAEGIINTRGITSSNGYDLTPYGEQLIKTWATYPSPSHDPGNAFWKQV
jgi:hypothetical protein